MGPFGLKGEKGLDGVPGTTIFNGDGVLNMTKVSSPSNFSIKTIIYVYILYNLGREGR